MEHNNRKSDDGERVDENRNDDRTTVDSDDIEAALRRVRDPDADVTVFEAGLIEDIRVDDGHVAIDVDLSDFPPQEAQSVTQTLIRAASDVAGVERTHVEHVQSQPMAEDRSLGIGAADRVIAVASAKGGVGKSTVATSLACALAVDGDDVGIFDADIHGPNVPELLSVSGPIHSDEDGNPIPVDAGGLEMMSVGLMSSSAPLAWRGAMAHDALTELFEETAWDDPDTIVLDLPPGTGDVALTTLQEAPVDGVVFVTTPFHAAVSDTHRSIQLFEENDVPVLGVVSNMGEFVCEECGHPHELFEGTNPVESLEIPVLAEIPFSPEMQQTPRPTSDELSYHARELGTAVNDRFDEIWEVNVPEGAVDLRDVPPENRRDRVGDAFEDVELGERFYIVSDRDPTPVREYLLELIDDGERLESFETRRQNPDTWLVRTVLTT
ncbi:P-loop NTPase [Saliphagus infecundisoli]|uniref:Iron-sulfur cluster carrier protein n=1 Tax=Saliphagus infecundisoli TaxID=1849069 RepID=A0ABD5QLT8_9EURY|nr:P-loop NTPase [Saliphagus infecundisoli]